LHRRIQQKRLLVSRTQEEIAALEAALRVLDSDDRSAEAPDQRLPRRASAHPNKGAILPDSDIGRAKTVLEEAGKPLRVDDIVSAIEIRFAIRPARASLIGSLARYSKARQHFYRAKGPNTFGVLGDHMEVQPPAI
jgi:hypothetical protein